MNADRELVNATTRDVLDVGPVLEGELVDESERPRLVSWRDRFARWWRYSPRVPMALKGWTNVRQAVRHAAVWLLVQPWRYARAVVRGLVVAVRWWRSWVKVGDYRDAAVASEKLADKFTEIRELTIFRWKVTGAVLVAVVCGVLTTYLVYGEQVWWWTGAVASVSLAVLGRRKDGSPGRKPVLSGPRSLTWTMDPQVLVDAFRDAKLIGKDETLRLVERAARQGDGWAVTVDLPATRKAADVVKNRDALASALAVDEVQLITERVRGNGGHAGRVALWVADADPYASAPLRTPLLGVARWDAWRPVPFGRDARNRRIDLPLVWTSLLVGAIPRQGKTFAARLAAAGLILDPHTRLYVADFKAGKDWDAVGLVAHRFMSGDEPAHVLALIDWLVELVGEVQGRYRRMRELDDLTCPESKITPAMARDLSLDMPITPIVIDEVQVPLEERTPVAVQGKRLPAGEYVGELLTWLAKKGPAAGVVLVLATQRPDSKTIPSGLRAVLGSRFALRVMDWRDSNIVLGEQMNTRGYDSSRLLPSHKGVGILRPDGETDAGADVLAMTVRTYYMPNEDWRVICRQGRALREQEGTLTGHAAGQNTPPVIERADLALAIGTPQPRHEEEAADDRIELPEPLGSVINYLDDHDDGRTFVTSAELIDALGADATWFGRQMSELGCRSTRERVETDGGTRQARGYRLVDLRAAADRIAEDDDGGADRL
ncbi:DNA segregation ATPase FtsK/SpoIIIE, S-DNA-T family [Actinokineospora alba]|uniref:DNA segregation ATPase FtsK/SpoIIIE, S-DNA-T family n=1 Tax=Actinokineospora alba TaxID=504798 RepID=A0A1H0SYA5_9PSEU|nr:FtsK/SpoIIIE domain-containing protein [Actinokineospora alba]TDP66482.1 S-DNA-T family DNA segregation ATPase FtsK/SpoIIIE [Actinokineospora alba]SDJ52747.1 DNA segregation ATPase FtsK/SpoIIIE, S-DNA-T family [Actinokineospora alba]SDP46540.1 DNA segregation ATPase FtsK/SpoIIIE, S-DNA-T family [Actinokineospora alba]